MQWPVTTGYQSLVTNHWLLTSFQHFLSITSLFKRFFLTFLFNLIYLQNAIETQTIVHLLLSYHFLDFILHLASSGYQAVCLITTGYTKRIKPSKSIKHPLNSLNLLNYYECQVVSRNLVTYQDQQSLINKLAKCTCLTVKLKRAPVILAQYYAYCLLNARVMRNSFRPR